MQWVFLLPWPLACTFKAPVCSLPQQPGGACEHLLQGTSLLSSQPSRGPTSLRVKAQVLPVARQALRNLLITSRSHLLPFPPPTVIRLLPCGPPPCCSSDTPVSVPQGLCTCRGGCCFFLKCFPPVTAWLRPHVLQAFVQKSPCLRAVSLKQHCHPSPHHHAASSSPW